MPKKIEKNYSKDRIYFASLPHCNEKCLFCVRGGKAKPIKYLNTEKAKKWIFKAGQEKWKTLIFDGGEPTLRKDLAELITFAQKSGFKNISILTNGIKLANKNFTKKLSEAIQGRKQKVTLSFCFSLHSHKKKISEYLVNTPNTFEKTLKGIHNIIELNIPFSIYHVITTYNYKDLPDFIDFLQVNFPLISSVTFSFIYPAGAALENKHIFPQLSKMEPYLYRAMAKAKKYNINFSISTCGTIPLCFLQGYEIYTINQQKADQPENVGLIDSGKETRSQLATKKFHKESKIKSQKCNSCLLNDLCSGLWKLYAEIYGTDELRPITDLSHYRKVMADLGNLEETKKEKAVSPYVYIGYQCNNNCIFCSEADEYMKNLKYKSTNKIKKEIIAIRGKYDFVNFMGREPTLRKDFIELLQYTKGLKFRQVGFTTNGRMLAYKDFVRKVLDAGINQIVISLNGATPEMHDSLTQVDGSFLQTIKGIKNVVGLKKEGFSLIVNLLLNKINYCQLKQMIDLVSGLGVKEINILNAAPLSRRSRDKNIIMKMSDLSRYVVGVLKKYKDNSHAKFLLVEFLPCSIPKAARKYFFPCLEKNPNKEKIPLCKNCPYADRCDGVLNTYIDLYGTKEFKL